MWLCLNAGLGEVFVSWGVVRIPCEMCLKYIAQCQAHSQSTLMWALSSLWHGVFSKMATKISYPFPCHFLQWDRSVSSCWSCRRLCLPRAMEESRSEPFSFRSGHSNSTSASSLFPTLSCSHSIPELATIMWGSPVHKKRPQGRAPADCAGKGSLRQLASNPDPWLHEPQITPRA